MKRTVFRQFFCALLAFLLLVPCLALAKEKKAKDAVAEAIDLYGAGETEAADALLEEVAATDPALYENWRSIFDCWQRLNAAPLTAGLPDGLPDTDELCIVVLGYQLTAAGKMREELYRRLDLALACAQQYPNAYILCTGGHTAANAPEASEAELMVKWLRRKGVDPKRLLAEKDSLTTTENALYTYKILTKNCPSVKALAVVSSDYHVRSGAMILEAAGTLLPGEGAEPAFHVLACAGCTLRPDRENTGYAVSGLKSLLNRTAGK